jgi:hypothetical protein
MRAVHHRRPRPPHRGLRLLGTGRLQQGPGQLPARPPHRPGRSRQRAGAAGVRRVVGVVQQAARRRQERQVRLQGVRPVQVPAVGRSQLQTPQGRALADGVGVEEARGAGGCSRLLFGKIRVHGRYRGGITITVERIRRRRRD